MATTLGLDRAAFDSCYDSGKYAQLIEDQYQQAHDYGLTGTPGFVINGKPLGSGVPPSLDYWRQLFRQYLPGVVAREFSFHELVWAWDRTKDRRRHSSQRSQR